MRKKTTKPKSRIGRTCRERSADPTRKQIRDRCAEVLARRSSCCCDRQREEHRRRQTILTLLSCGGSMRGSALARALDRAGMSDRTIDDDLAALCDAGLVARSGDGPSRRYRIVSGIGEPAKVEMPNVDSVMAVFSAKAASRSSIEGGLS